MSRIVAPPYITIVYLLGFWRSTSIHGLDAFESKNLAYRYYGLFFQTEKKLDNMEPSLNPNLKDMLDEIEALKNKTEMNRAQAEEAKAAADAVLQNTTGLDEVRHLSANQIMPSIN